VKLFDKTLAEPCIVLRKILQISRTPRLYGNRCLEKGARSCSEFTADANSLVAIVRIRFVLQGQSKFFVAV
jgi:hypothetical protein